MGWLGEISFGTAAQTGLFTGQINQATPSLGHCPESTVWRESHLTLVHWLKGASIITVQHSPSHLLFLFLRLLPLLFLLLSSLPCSPPLYYHGSSFLLPAMFFPSSPPLPLKLCYSLHALQHNRLPSGGCDLRRNVISSPAIGSAPLKSVVTVSYYIVYLPEGGGSRTLTIFKSARSGATTSPCVASLSWWVVQFIKSTVIPVRIGLRMRTRWRELSWMLRCL